MGENKSLITKYRPQSFEEVYGHEKEIESIKRLFRSQSPNAFCLTGPSGSGKTTLARLIAKEFGANEASISEVDAATYTGIDNMRELMESLTYKPLMGDKRAVIIDEAQAASKQASQSILKSLEEPPEGVVWILCTTDPDKILKTIRTRCYEYDLQPLDTDTIFDIIADIADQEEFELSDEVLDVVAEHSEGSPRIAISNLDVCQGLDDPSHARELIKTAGNGEASNLAKMLLKGEYNNWKELANEAKKAVTENGNNTESVRLGVVNYIGKALSNTKDMKQAAKMLNILEAFSEPYNPQEGLAPLMRSIGIVVFDAE